MEFRSYQLFLLVSVALLVAALFMPVSVFVEPNGATAVLSNFSLQNPDGSNSYMACAAGVVLVFSALVNAFTLFVSLFRNFELQKRAIVLSLLLFVGYYILEAIFMLLLCDTASVNVQLALLFPFMAIVLNALCFFAIRRAEAKIIASSMGFRLRD